MVANPDITPVLGLLPGQLRSGTILKPPSHPARRVVGHMQICFCAHNGTNGAGLSYERIHGSSLDWDEQAD